MHWFFF